MARCALPEMAARLPLAITTGILGAPLVWLPRKVALLTLAMVAWRGRDVATVDVRVLWDLETAVALRIAASRCWNLSSWCCRALCLLAAALDVDCSDECADMTRLELWTRFRLGSRDVAP